RPPRRMRCRHWRAAARPPARRADAPPRRRPWWMKWSAGVRAWCPLFGGALDIGADRLRRHDKEQRREHRRKRRDHERIAYRLRAIRSLQEIVEIADHERAETLSEARRG